MNRRNIVFFCSITISMLYLATDSFCSGNERLNDLHFRSVELYHQAQYEEALKYAQEAEKIALKEYKQGHQEHLISLDNLAELYMALQRYDKAEEIYKNLVALKQKAYGVEDSTAVLKELRNLGKIYVKQSRSADAENLYNRILTINEKLPDKFELFSDINEFAGFYEQRGDYNSALKLYKKALAEAEKIGEHYFGVMASLNKLGTVYLALKQYKEAETVLNRNLELLQNSFGMHNPDIIKTLELLAEVYIRMKKYTQAESIYKRQWNLLESRLGKEPPEIIPVYENLSELYEKTGRKSHSDDYKNRASALKTKYGK